MNAGSRSGFETRERLSRRAAAFGFEMLLGTVVKATKWHKPFTDDSYDLLLLALCLLLLALGPGAYRV